MEGQAWRSNAAHTTSTRALACTQDLASSFLLVFAAAQGTDRVYWKHRRGSPPGRGGRQATMPGWFDGTSGRPGVQRVRIGAGARVEVCGAREFAHRRGRVAVGHDAGRIQLALTRKNQRFNERRCEEGGSGVTSSQAAHSGGGVYKS
jgi:hypothetical protein